MSTNNTSNYKLPPIGAYNLYVDLIKKPHLLIGGTTGSGKSCLINGIITTLLLNSPAKSNLYLIDPKRIELAEYKKIVHTKGYASETQDIVFLLNEVIDIMENRFTEMSNKNLRMYDGSDIYVIIDELADLMTTIPKKITPLLQRIAQLGRAARIHLIVATQCPLATVIPTKIKVNFDTCIGLHTRNAQDSRNLIGVKGCEKLPLYGYCLITEPTGIKKHTVPLYDEQSRQYVINFWKELCPWWNSWV